MPWPFSSCTQIFGQPEKTISNQQFAFSQKWYLPIYNKLHERDAKWNICTAHKCEENMSGCSAIAIVRVWLELLFDIFMNRLTPCTKLIRFNGTPCCYCINQLICVERKINFHLCVSLVLWNKIYCDPNYNLVDSNTIAYGIMTSILLYLDIFHISWFHTLMSSMPANPFNMSTISLLIEQFAIYWYYVFNERNTTRIKLYFWYTPEVAYLRP